MTAVHPAIALSCDLIEGLADMNDMVTSGIQANAADDLFDLEIETFEVESLSDLGIVAAAAAEESLTVASTSSTTSSSCG